MDYRRNYVPGGTYFFTVVTHLRRKIFHRPEAISILRESFVYVQKNHPFKVMGYVFLPDHLHMIWTLPEGDSNFSTRWRLIKSKFSRDFPTDFLDIPSTQSKITRGERLICPFHFVTGVLREQRRFWEHTIRDENDLHNHLNYIHFNPVKHGYVEDPLMWDLSSYAKFVERGDFLGDWDKETGTDMPDYDV